MRYQVLILVALGFFSGCMGSALFSEARLLPFRPLIQADILPGRSPNPEIRLLATPLQWREYLGDRRPEPDWSRAVALAVALGRRPTGGYAMTVRQIALRGRELEIVGAVRTPAPGELVIEAFTYPIHVVEIPRASLPGGRFAARLLTEDGQLLAYQALSLSD